MGLVLWDGCVRLDGVPKILVTPIINSSSIAGGTGPGPLFRIIQKMMRNVQAEEVKASISFYSLQNGSKAHYFNI